jgi:iron transport multicopper oxidase
MWEFFVFLASVATLASAQIIHWNVSWVERCPDGVCRPVIGVNGHWPIRPVVVEKGSHYTLRVFNNLNDTSVYDYVENVTIHTHGIDEVGTTYYDGVDGVTQWYLTSSQFVNRC